MGDLLPIAVNIIPSEHENPPKTTGKHVNKYHGHLLTMVTVLDSQSMAS